MNVLLVAAGAAVGAPLRYLVRQVLPWGTLLVNVLGSALLGALGGLGTALPQPLFVLLGTGFCGALTTYSTFSWEVLELVERRAWLAAGAEVVASVVAGVCAAVLMYRLVS